MSMTFEGVYTALVTPMRDGDVDYDAMSRLIEAQIDAGIHGLVPVGTTGESATLTAREQAQVIRHVVHTVNKRVPVIAGAGANSTAVAIELSKASADAGADGLLHVTPYYNKPSPAGLYRHFSAIAEAVPLPVMLYNVPGRTACDLTTDTVERLAEIDNIAAIKDATADMRRCSELIARVGDRIAVMSGDDFTAVTLFALGGKGVVSVVSNVLPGEVVDMWNAVNSGDLATARKRHFDMFELVEVLFAEPNPQPVKAALEILGRVEPEIRPPLVSASEDVRRQLQTWLKAKGRL